MTFVEALWPLYALRSNDIMIAGISKAEERWRSIRRAREYEWLTGRGYPCSDMHSVRIEVLLFQPPCHSMKVCHGLVRHNVDLLGSDGRAAALHFTVLPCVVVGRFLESMIGMAGRFLLDARNMQVCRRAQAPQATRVTTFAKCGEVNRYGREKNQMVL